MTKKKFNLGDFVDEHFGWFVLAGIILLIAIIICSAYVYNIYASDYRVYEDNQIICYSDSGVNDQYNSNQEYYCITRNTRVKTCEYAYSRGSGNKPPQGCYL